MLGAKKKVARCIQMSLGTGAEATVTEDGSDEEVLTGLRDLDRLRAHRVLTPKRATSAMEPITRDGW